MALSQRLESCCNLLESSKIKERKEGCDVLNEHLRQKTTIEYLQEHEDWWPRLLSAVQSCMAKERTKIIEDSKKKGTVPVTPQSADVFDCLIRTATRENVSSLNFRSILSYLLEDLNDRNKKCFHSSFLRIISHNFLSNTQIRSLLKASDWEQLYLVVKSLCEKKNVEREEWKCLGLVIKWGPLYQLSPSLIREEFTFVTKLCHEISSSALKQQEEAIIEILYDFSIHTAKDNRMACCKLGEDIFKKLIEIYERNSHDDCIKMKLFEFFLLQVALHNPGGVKNEHPAAYAVSWHIWKNCLFNIHDILTNEIDKTLGVVRRTFNFCLVKNGVSHLSEPFNCLFVDVCRQLFDTSVYNESEEPPNKRAKRDLGVCNLIEKIKQTKSWIWLNLVCCLVERYPDIINSNEYVSLLNFLISLISKTKETNLIHHIYKTLIVLKTNEGDVKVTSDIGDVWRGLAEAVLRLMSLNQNDEELQILLQQLISENHITSHETLLQYYRPGSSLNITIANLKTLNLAFRHFTCLQFDNNTKSDAIRWILTSLANQTDSKLFSDGHLAGILVSLVSKQWNSDFRCQPKRIKKLLGDIEDVYLATSFDHLLLCSEVGNDEVTSSVCVDQGLLNNLIGLLVEFDSGKGTISDLLNITVFIFNIISHLLHFEIIEFESPLVGFFDGCAKNLFGKFRLEITESDERHLEDSIRHIQILNVLFSIKISDSLTKRLRSYVPEELIRSMFLGLNIQVKDVTTDSRFVTFKKSLVQTIVTYSCLPKSTELNEIQQRALAALIERDYNCVDDFENDLVLTILQSIKCCQPKTLGENTLLAIFNLFQKLCESRYHCYLSAVKILDMFYDIYPFVAASDSDICKNHFGQILYPFYLKRLDYGPDVSKNLLKCIGLLYELEPECRFSRWQNDEIILKVPEFLTSDYLDVRFTSIKILAKFFKLSSKTLILEQFHRQEIMFSFVSEMSLKMFEIEGTVSEERLIDETVTRSASMLHNFASIMVASHLWVEEALLTLLRIVCDKKLDLIQVRSVIETVAKNLGFNSGLNLLEKHLTALVTSWKSHNMQNFPFRLYNCDSKIEFYVKYWSLLAYHVAENDANDLNHIAEKLGKTLPKLIEDTCPTLLSHCLSREVTDLASVTSNKIYKLLNDTLGIGKCRQIFKNNIEEVLLRLTDFICDESEFEKSFNRKIIFPKSNQVRLSVDEFLDCLHFIEGSLYNETSVISDLMENSPEKVHFVLLQLNLRINTALALEDKLRHFHIYSIVLFLCVDAVLYEPSMQLYLTRDLTYRLLHYIRNYKNQPVLSQISCIFFKNVLKKLLPQLSDVVKQFFAVIVSRLKNIALEECPISDYCIDMLQLLIVDYKDLFLEEIAKIDAIPNEAKFEKVFSVHYAIKYTDRKVTLEDEINQFLDFGQNIECQHSLTHLRQVLTEKKDELGELYTKLRQTRGFSEDCEKSSLHKLVCMLITLSCSVNRNVSTEAVRCLGEIGPADLATLILQPEKGIPDPKWTPLELLLTDTLSLLLKFIIDSDVTIVKVASVTLFQVLASKEGRKVAELSTDINSHYLTPFCGISVNKTGLCVAVDGDMFVKIIGDDDLWIPKEGCHSTWVCNLVCTLLGTFKERAIFSSFIEICKVKTEFCEQILPLLIYVIVNLNITTITNLISTKIESFFTKHWKITVNNEKCDSITVNKASVQTMLNVIHFVRLQTSVRKKNKQVTNMTLDYLKVAKAAHFCTAHFTALLYADLWCQEQINKSSDDYALSSCTYTKLDLICEKIDHVTANALQNILRQAYKAVGEVDALFGCGTSHLLSPVASVEHYKEQGRWDQVTHHYDMEIGAGDVRPLVDSLKSAKLYKLSLLVSDGNGESDYECLWRLGQWDGKSGSSSCDNYDKCKFYALKAMRDKDEFSFIKSMEDGRGCVIREFIGANMESIKNFYSSLGRLQALKEIEDFVEALKGDKLDELLVKWKVQDEITSNDYNYFEPIHAQRIVLLTDYLKASQKVHLKEVIIDTIIGYAQCARIEGNPQEASRILKQLSFLPCSNDMAAKMKLEEAQRCWSINDSVRAKCILRHFCSDENVNPRLHAMALKMMGTWMVESSSENRQTIIENYFQKSLNLLKTTAEKTSEDEKSVLDTFDQLAKFTDQGYQEVMSHIKSDIFQKKKENMNKAIEAVSKVDLKKATKDQRKAVAIKQKLSCIDQTEINNIESEKNNLLRHALKYYLLNLIGSDEINNSTIFRLISLLLENRNNEIVRVLLEKDLLKVPSYRFIPVLPQIIPHIGGPGCDVFSKTINDVIERCAKDHPYHTLPLILALALSNKDRDYAESKAAVNDGRMQNAKSLLARLKKQPNLSKLIEKMEFLSEAIIELAYYKSDSDDDDGRYKVPRRCKIRKIQDYDDVLLPTYRLPVNPSCDYSRGVVGIRGFSDVYQNVGGINAPKRITCKGTDGLSHSQLVKGQDDLRQDAVMQQVFTIMNSLLAVNKQTKNLQIRTYKIVPLSMRSGILEWVENTMPIGEYLIGDDNDSGAHVKYRPQDKSPRRCRMDFKNSANSSNEERVRIFNKICQNIQPVFHKFFELTFPQPTVWYERRRAYIHSVAASSMCGYILGIGDRHLNNILIDKSTAEVVHIDFGIAFEQGRVLPTPETVPFRLSRDMVDGMGVSGVEGVFRRSCEKTVEVLRTNYRTIVTILEVLLYDPLYDWTVSNAEANKRQKDDLNESLSMTGSDEKTKAVNVTAERALLRLRAKLQGMESGKATTVEHQVGTLIQQAVDPSNLSKLFHGWQPYL